MKTLKKISGVLFLLILMVSCMQKDNLTDEQTVNAGNDLLATRSAGITETIEGRYIVVFNDNVTNPAVETAKLKGMFGLETGHIYEHSLKGFSAKIPAQALNGLRNHPLIAYIEPDFMLYANEQTIPTGIIRIEAANPSPAAVDVDVAIIDTGIDKDHPELNVVGGVRYYLGFLTDNLYDDDNGHGSHVAGIIGARNNTIGVVGIVPGARLWAVKVLNKRGSGFSSDIIKGLEWVEARAGDIEVANMSLGGTGYSDSYRTAIKGCVDAGVVVVVAAGNSAVDVYGADGIFQTSDDYVPAAYPEAATISAMADSDGVPGGSGGNTSYGPDDSFATFSNFSRSVITGNPVNSPGLAIDLILPGVDILSCYKDMNYAIMSGTSMASPHGAGLAALYISKHTRATNAAGVYAIRQALIDAGKTQSDPVYGLENGGDPDGHLENLGWAGSSTPPVNQPPVANAGPDQSVSDYDGTLSETVTLNGAGSTDDKVITSFIWEEGGAPIASGVNPSVILPVGIHTIILTVADAEGLTDADEVVITVTANAAPTAQFNFTVNNLIADFTDLSTDDGTIIAWSWDFGDGGSSSIQNPSHPYALAGTYIVTLTVTDNGERSSFTSQNVTVTAPDPGSINLTATGYKVKGLQKVDLVWTSGTGTYNVYRNDFTNPIASDLGGNTFTDNINKKGGATYIYKVCRVGTTTCSNEATVVF